MHGDKPEPDFTDAEFEVIHDPHAAERERIAAIKEDLWEQYRPQPLPAPKKSAWSSFKAGWRKHMVPPEPTPDEKAVFAEWKRQQPWRYRLAYYSNLIAILIMAGMLYGGIYVYKHWGQWRIRYEIEHGLREVTPYQPPRTP